MDILLVLVVVGRIFPRVLVWDNAGLYWAKAGPGVNDNFDGGDWVWRKAVTGPIILVTAAATKPNIIIIAVDGEGRRCLLRLPPIAVFTAVASLHMFTAAIVDRW